VTPELLRWVHATLIDSMMLAWDRFVGPLAPAERDRYCAEATSIEPLLGIPAGLLRRRARSMAWPPRCVSPGASRRGCFVSGRRPGEVAAAAGRLLDGLTTRAEPKHREVEAAKARARAAARVA
jgi:hypothetical protein